MYIYKFEGKYILIYSVLFYSILKLCQLVFLWKIPGFAVAAVPGILQGFGSDFYIDPHSFTEGRLEPDLSPSYPSKRS